MSHEHPTPFVNRFTSAAENPLSATMVDPNVDFTAGFGAKVTQNVAYYRAPEKHHGRG
jgi:hypothetical protein